METSSKIARSLLNLIPRKVRRFFAEFLGLVEVSKRLDKLEDEMVKKNDIGELIERIKLLEEATQPLSKKRSQQRWIAAPPDGGLTWGRQVSGDDFIKKVISYNVLNPKSTLLEIGPGYGRLLRSLLEQKASFRRYTGVDISIENIEYLKETFIDSRISFLLEDFENTALEDTFDIAISSLTFKHLYPSFEKMLSTISQHLVRGGWIFFDLIEGTPRAYFEDDRITFIRHYSREEIDKILRRTDFYIVAYDQVVHDDEHTRLLVVAKKTKRMVSRKH
jgi:SAM-dependent methyltransferase